ncbi:MAG: class I tRNA ligase family protein, partial [Candidatus Pacebacteria bacterium]|nr:class I tRNA ligase family protein [Candidatus Paceibacterota bacterium]
TLEKFEKRAPNGEDLTEMKNRVMEFLHETDKKYKNKKILIVTHEYVTWLLTAGVKGLDAQGSVLIKNEAEREHFLENAEIQKLDLVRLPHNRNYETDLHRPYIDEITYPCSCGGKMKRVPDVFDCWFESGSMPYAQLHYPFENKKEFKDNFPADFIAEGLDQTRGWFYSLLVLSVGLFGETPYKNVIVNGMALAEDGQKMSKSLKNYPDPMSVVDKYSADALRYYLLASPIVRAETLNFSEKGVGEVSRKVIARTLNVLSFYQMYEKRAEKKVVAKESKNVLDKWILARLNELIDKVSAGFDTYQLDRATRPIGDFVDDLSTWYVRRSRARFKGDDVEDRDYALATTRYVLEEFSKMIAPIMPFVAEHLYKEVGGKEESVHLEDWLEPKKTDEKVLEEMAEVRNVVSLALEARATVGMKVRQPLLKLTIKSEVLNGKKELLEVVRDEVNVKEMVVNMNMEEITELNTELNTELIQEGQFRELVRHIQSLRKKTGLTPDDMVTASIKTDMEGKKLVEKFKEELMKTTLLEEVVFSDVEVGEEINIDDLKFIVMLEK